MLDKSACLAWQRTFFPEGLEVLASAPVGHFALAGTTVLTAGEAGSQPARNIVSTLNFQHVDTGIESGGIDVRAELFAIADQPAEQVAAAVAQAATLMQGSAGMLPARPGTLIAGLADAAGLPASLTARHGLCIAPSTWAKGVPQYVEGNQMVLMLQLILITQEELDYALTYSPIELVGALAQENIAVTNWQRAPRGE